MGQTDGRLIGVTCSVAEWETFKDLATLDDVTAVPEWLVCKALALRILPDVDRAPAPEPTRQRRIWLSTGTIVRLEARAVASGHHTRAKPPVPKVGPYLRAVGRLVAQDPEKYKKYFYDLRAIQV